MRVGGKELGKACNCYNFDSPDAGRTTDGDYGSDVRQRETNFATLGGPRTSTSNNHMQHKPSESQR